MTRKISNISFIISLLLFAAAWSAIPPAIVQVNVTQFHNHDSRNGLSMSNTIHLMRFALKNRLTKSAEISINGVFPHLEVS